MDVNQTLVISLGKLMVALDRVVKDLGKSVKCMSTDAYHRLVAYELMASREVLDFNYIFKTKDGDMYMETRQSSLVTQSSQKGFVILRVPFLKAVTLLMEEYTENWKNVVHLKKLRGILVSRYKQRQCCWYSVSKKKACPCDATELETQKHQGYVFCRKHWSPILRNEGIEEGIMCPPSETTLDEWLEGIV